MTFYRKEEDVRRIDDLETENLNLKMQLMNLEQKCNSLIAYSPEKTDSSSDEIAFEIARGENDILRKKIADLEAEMLKLKAKSVKQDITDEIVGPLSPNSSRMNVFFNNSFDLTQMEENRRHERQIASTIADHDAKLIDRLKDEVHQLSLQHEHDLIVVGEYEVRLTDIIKKIDGNYGGSVDNLDDVKSMIIALREKLKIQVSKEELERKRNFFVNYGILEDSKDQLKEGSSLFNDTEYPHFPHDRNEIELNRSQEYINYVQDAPSTPDPKEKIKEGSQNSSSVSHAISQSTSSSSSMIPNSMTNSSLFSPFTREQLRQISGQGNFIGSSRNFPRKQPSWMWDESQSGAPTLDIKWEEVENLRRENQTIRDQLKAEREMFKTQEIILENLKSSTEEITLLEAEEMARLVRELERLSTEKNQWKEKCHDLEYEFTRLKKRLTDYEVTITRLERQNGILVEQNRVWKSKYRREELAVKSLSMSTSMAPDNRLNSKAVSTTSMEDSNKMIAMYK